MADEILIVGAGIAGLAMAKALELQGQSCELVERAEMSPTAGAGIFLLGNATRELSRLGLLANVGLAATTIPTQKIFDQYGNLLNEIITQSIWGQTGPCLALSRQSLIQILASSLKYTEPRYGKTVVKIESMHGAERVFFSDGCCGEYRAVIGADGVRSSVRTSIFGSAPPLPIGITCWRFITKNTTGIDGWTAMVGEKRTLLAIPVNKEELYIYADCPTDELRKQSSVFVSDMFSNFRGPLGHIIPELDKNTKIHCAQLEEVPMRRWAKARTVLIGDAAHGCSPSMAQGAGMALEDAHVLAKLISGRSNVEHAFATFYDQRMARVKWVQQQCHARDKLRNSPRFFRNMVLRSLGNSLYRKAYAPLTLDV